MNNYGTERAVYRGKSVKTNEWVYGSFVHADDSGTGRPYIYCLGSAIEVDPKSVGQYLGVKDSQGELIFEGDIVKSRTGNYYKVEWRQDLLEFSLKSLDENSKKPPYDNLVIGEDFKCFEVTGNTYDWENADNKETIPVWISVDDEPVPDDEARYIVFTNYQGRGEVECVKGWAARADVTHWMPLPKPPKKEQ